jgi:hypothetical protein
MTRISRNRQAGTIRSRSRLSVKNPSGPQHSNDADHDPEHIQENIGRVFFKGGTPRKNHRVGRVKRPDKEKRTFGPKPADQAETEYSHEHTNHFDDLDAPENELIYSIDAHGCRFSGFLKLGVNSKRFIILSAAKNPLIFYFY